ncbi:MAG: hypothetical protein ARM1_0467 [Candidatus Micrarchaeota archaeon]|nr:MAG: hypothetical protein ARM1_0467 [Candidatus Micrarchaeota archaeon]
MDLFKYMSLLDSYEVSLLENLDQKTAKELISQNIELIREDSVIDRDHIRIALLYSYLSTESKINKGRGILKEMLTFIALDNQISKAIEKIGYKDGSAVAVYLKDKFEIFNKYGVVARAFYRDPKEALEIARRIFGDNLDKDNINAAIMYSMSRLIVDRFKR